MHRPEPRDKTGEAGARWFSAKNARATSQATLNRGRAWRNCEKPAILEFLAEVLDGDDCATVGRRSRLTVTAVGITFSGIRGLARNMDFRRSCVRHSFFYFPSCRGA
jgi:hypothetical protein